MNYKKSLISHLCRLITLFVALFTSITFANHVYAQKWDFTVNTEGWTARNSNTNVRWSGDGNGRLYMDTCGDDPGMVSPDISLNASSNNLIKIYVWTYCDDKDAEIFFKKSGDSTVYSGGRIVLNYGVSGSPYEFDMRGVAAWTGTITQIRIDPSDYCGSRTLPYCSLTAISGFVAFDWIETSYKANNPPIVSFTVDQEI